MENFRYHFLALFTCFFAFGELSAQPSGSEMSLYGVLRQHRRALGQPDVLQKLNGTYSTGVIRQGEQEAKVKIYKSGGKLRTDLAVDGLAQIVSYDGKKAWQWSVRPQAEEVFLLTPEQTAWLEREALFGDLLEEFSNQSYRAELLDTARIEGVGIPVYHIRLTKRFREEQYDIYLDSSTFLERRREFRPDLESEPLVTLFSDFRTVNGVVLPFKIRNEFGGETISELIIEDIELNPGIFSLFFNPPAGLPVNGGSED